MATTATRVELDNELAELGERMERLRAGTETPPRAVQTQSGDYFRVDVVAADDALEEHRALR